MAVTNLVNDPVGVDTTLDSITIRKDIAGIIGGASLDVTGFTPAAIKSGHVVIKETATGVYKPMPIAGDAYAALPAGHTIEGVVRASTLTAKPMVGILYNGEVNEATSPYPVTTAIKTALTLIKFAKDERK